jgi:formylglycine-generating enzyme required for sulfatase activity
MDRTEVTLGDYNDCVKAGTCNPAAKTVDVADLEGQSAIYWGRLCNASRAADTDPMNCIDWAGATTYCQWKGGRLPTEAEWEYAASGGTGRTYPWGETAPSPSLLNGCGTECREFGRRLGVRWSVAFDAADSHPQTSPVDSYPNGASPFGLADMAGNVAEWTSSSYCTYPNGQCQAVRVVRGGSWRSGDVNAYRVARRSTASETTRDSTIGFRCAKTL